MSVHSDATALALYVATTCIPIHGDGKVEDLSLCNRRGIYEYRQCDMDRDVIGKPGVDNGGRFM